MLHFLWFGRYRLTGMPVDIQYKNITNPDVTNLLLEDLIIWTNYEIEVAAYNRAGLGVYSHKVTEWTLQGGRSPLVQPVISQLICVFVVFISYFCYFVIVVVVVFALYCERDRK